VQSLCAFEQALAPPVSRQIPPGTWFPVLVEQTPMLTTPPVVGEQWTWPVALPQHSVSLVHRLLMILQPRPGWQTSTPVAAHGPQFLLQQAPHPLQSTPSCVHWPVPLVPTSMQTPCVAPAALEQKPPQQSRSRAQTSPGWMQNDEPSTHLPPSQSPEQQPPAPPEVVAVQGLPAVRQAVLSGWHLPPVQVPLQHAAEELHAALSAVQLVALAQTPLAVHWRLQQSVLAAQVAPAAPQVVSRVTQVLDVPSQICEQHWALVVQATPTKVQVTPLPPLPVPPPPPAPA